MADLLLKNISKIYPGNVTAVKDLSLTIRDKEFLVLVGPSGCGKTTTLRMIAGLEEISCGELYIDDKLVNEAAPKDRDIAMVFQNYALYPHLSVFDNMAFGLKLRKLPKADIKRNVLEAARILDLEDLLERRPKELSGGQRQRVALGRAIVRKPKVFLMDEPLSNLDAQLRTHMRIEIAKLHKNLETTFIYVTHDQTEAMTMGTRIVVMKDGVVQQMDSPQHIYEHPHNMFVAGFIGNPRMNFLNALIIEQNDILYVKIADSLLILPGETAQKLKKKGYVGKEVILGIRAEHLLRYEYFSEYRELAEDSSIEEKRDYAGHKVYQQHRESADLDPALYPALTGKLEFVEMRGSESYEYISIAGGEVVVRVDAGCRTETGQDVKVGINMNKAHIFDQDSGLNTADLT